MAQAEAGKGSRPRPFSVSQKEYDERWDAIFSRDIKEEAPKKGTCGCGRSPTGNCIGWHSLTEEAFQLKLTEWKEKNLSK
jgi:hypothetical protein